jgi:hypothetical protein
MTNASVWKFFAKNNEEIQCKLCSQVYPRPKDGSTGNLLYHLEHAHYVERSKLASFSGAQQPLVLGQRPSRAATTRVVTEWLVRDLRPMSTVDSASFRALCELFGADVPHSRNLTRTYLPRLYEACKAHITNMIADSKGTVSYTTDAWTDKHNTRSYMTLSANVVLDWKLTTFCLATRHVKEAHTADNLVVWTGPLQFWREHATRWPHLSNIATRFLAVMPSSAEAERTFSTSGDVLTPLRSNLKPDRVDKLVFLAKNLRAGRIPPDVIASAFVESL